MQYLDVQDREPVPRTPPREDIPWLSKMAILQMPFPVQRAGLHSSLDCLQPRKLVVHHHCVALKYYRYRMATLHNLSHNHKNLAGVLGLSRGGDRVPVRRWSISAISATLPLLHLSLHVPSLLASTTVNDLYCTTLPIRNGHGYEDHENGNDICWPF